MILSTRVSLQTTLLWSMATTAMCFSTNSLIATKPSRQTTLAPFLSRSQQSSSLSVSVEDFNVVATAANDASSSISSDIVAPAIDVTTMITAIDTTDLILGGVAVASIIGLAVLAASEESQDTEGNMASSPSTEASAKPIAVPEEEKKADAILTPSGETSEDLVVEKEKALNAFRRGSSEDLQDAISSLISKVETTRVNLGKEKALRADAESEISKIALEIQDLEDKYELGQNALQRTIKSLQKSDKDLGEARKTLEETRKSLEFTAASLAKLEEERQSFRKLGRAAWQLSKKRVRGRFESVRSRFRSSGDSADKGSIESKSEK